MNWLKENVEGWQDFYCCSFCSHFPSLPVCRGSITSSYLWVITAGLFSQKCTITRTISTFQKFKTVNAWHHWTQTCSTLLIALFFQACGFPKLYCFIICSSSNFHDKSFPWSSFHATYISRKAHSLHLSKAISVSNWIQWTSYHPTIISQFFQLTPNIFPNHQRKDNIACQVSLCFCSVISLAFSLDTPCGTCLLSAASNALARASEFPAAPLGTPSEVPAQALSCWASAPILPGRNL